MRAFFHAMILAALFLTATSARAAEPKTFHLKVLDEQGQPVPKFEAMIYSGSGLRWAAGADGKVSLSAEQLPPLSRIVVRADGFASAARQFPGNEREKMLRGEQSITLPRGEEVKLQFHLPAGMNWPKAALPEVYFDAWKEVVQSARSAEGRQWYEARNGAKPVDFNMLNFHPDDAGNFVFRLAASTPPFSVGVNIAGFLQHFDVGPFTLSDFKSGSLQIDVPQPASLEITLNVGATPADKLPFKIVHYQVMLQNPNRNSSTVVAAETRTPDAKPIVLNDIPSGNYYVQIITLSNGNANQYFGEEADPRRFRDSKQFSLRPGQKEKIECQYVPLDDGAFHGKRTAIVQINTADGKPAAGRDVAISYYVEHYGLRPVFSGPVPETGEITLKDITDASSSPRGGQPYSVRIGKDRAGGFGFQTNDPTEHFVFRCPPMAGDMAPDVELLNVADGKTIKLSDLRGKLVVLDFWATWCGPCQPALEKLDTVAAEKADAWKDRVVVVPVSIDNEAEQAKKHLIDRGWTHLHTYWTGAEGKLSFEAPAMQAFVVNGVPTSFLIDPQGKILWRGHPLSNDGGKTLEDRIEAALSGATGKDEPTPNKTSQVKPAAASDQSAGESTGRLIDIQDQPISGAKVTASSRGAMQFSLSIDGVAQPSAIPSSTTDEKGIFSIPMSLNGTSGGGKMVPLLVRTKDGHSYEANIVPSPHGAVDVHLPTHLQPKSAGPQNVGAEEFAGLVVDEQGQPLEGVEVDAWDWYKHPGNEMTTRADGLFRLTDLDHESDGAIEVRFRKPGYSPETFIEQPIGKNGWVLALSNKTSFEGTVSGPDGKPAAGTSIRANQGPKYAAGCQISDIWTETKSDGSGRYRLYVQPDDYEFLLKCPGVGVARLPKTAIQSGESAPLDIRLQPGATFQANVVDSETNQPVPNLRLWNWQHKDVEGRSNKDGLVTIRDMIPGSFQFSVEADGYTRWWSEQAKNPWQRKSIAKPELKWQRNFDNLDFDIQPGMPPVAIVMERGVRVRGRVLDPDGNPVAGATVAPALTGTGNSLTGDTRFSVETKSDGTFEVWLPASHDAKYNLIAHDGKYTQWRKWANGVLPPISTTPGQQIDGVELQLTRPATVRGKVVDAQGKPVAGREVRASAVDKLENRYYDPTTKTKEDATFELKFVRPSDQYVQVAPFWLTAEQAPEGSSKRVTLAAGQELNDVELTAAN